MLPSRTGFEGEGSDSLAFIARRRWEIQSGLFRSSFRSNLPDTSYSGRSAKESARSERKTLSETDSSAEENSSDSERKSNVETIAPSASRAQFRRASLRRESSKTSQSAIEDKRLQDFSALDISDIVDDRGAHLIDDEAIPFVESKPNSRTTSPISSPTIHHSKDASRKLLSSSSSFRIRSPKCSDRESPWAEALQERQFVGSHDAMALSPVNVSRSFKEDKVLFNNVKKEPPSSTGMSFRSNDDDVSSMRYLFKENSNPSTSKTPAAVSFLSLQRSISLRGLTAPYHETDSATSLSQPTVGSVAGVAKNTLGDARTSVDMPKTTAREVTSLQQRSPTTLHNDLSFRNVVVSHRNQPSSTLQCDNVVSSSTSALLAQSPPPPCALINHDIHSSRFPSQDASPSAPTHPLVHRSILPTHTINLNIELAPSTSLGPTNEYPDHLVGMPNPPLSASSPIQATDSDSPLFAESSTDQWPRPHVHTNLSLANEMIDTDPRPQQTVSEPLKPVSSSLNDMLVHSATNTNGVVRSLKPDTDPIVNSGPLLKSMTCSLNNEPLAHSSQSTVINPYRLRCQTPEPISPTRIALLKPMASPLKDPLLVHPQYGSPLPNTTTTRLRCQTPEPISPPDDGHYEPPNYNSSPHSTHSTPSSSPNEDSSPSPQTRISSSSKSAFRIPISNVPPMPLSASPLLQPRSVADDINRAEDAHVLFASATSSPSRSMQIHGDVFFPSPGMPLLASHRLETEGPYSEPTTLEDALILLRQERMARLRCERELHQLKRHVSYQTKGRAISKGVKAAMMTVQQKLSAARHAASEIAKQAHDTTTTSNTAET